MEGLNKTIKEWQKQKKLCSRHKTILSEEPSLDSSTKRKNKLFTMTRLN